MANSMQYTRRVSVSIRVLRNRQTLLHVRSVRASRRPSRTSNTSSGRLQSPLRSPPSARFEGGYVGACAATFSFGPASSGWDRLW
ncbi:hypothetical protein BD311DRAFT_753522 [Dichomitus squalens]|uniref:Uncharacterized protein n=1 Tax=Dichomitus squalens TaxID=114155 RepID=A0A4Q9MUQ5_9APHY|nr:hypothetical protein BD311DRAFT_753522 [Dichomitus squalens]